MDLKNIKTKSGKTIKDFQIPEELLKNDPSLVDLILRSESMKDDERQYWLNLTKVMTKEQIEKLRDILTRERKKLAEIRAKYGKKEELSPEEIAKRNLEMKKRREEQAAKLREREKAEEAKEDEDAILAELDNV